MDIEARLAELQQGGSSLDEAVRQIFREDYSADVKELVRLTGKDAVYIGRLKGQVSKAHGPKRVTPSTPVEQLEMTPPIVTEFKAAVDDLLEKSTGRFKEHLAILFQRQADKLIKNREAFENFLLRSGLTPVQANGVIERIMVVTGPAPAGPGVQTVQIPGVGYVILQPSTIQGQPSGQPIIVQSPGAGVQTGETSRIESRLDKLEEKLQPIIEHSGRTEPLMRRGRRAILDAEANIKTDAAGNILWEEYEEPWEPGAKDTLTETLLPLIVKQLIGGKPKEIDEEALVLKIKEKLAPPAGEGQGKITTEQIRDAVRSEVSDVKRDIETLKQDQSRRESQEGIDRAVDRARAEDKAIIDSLTAEIGERRGYTGLSDSQAGMKYQKDVIDGLVDAVGVQIASVRADIRPLILQQAVTTMKAQGMTDDIIGQFLSAVRTKVPLTGAIAEGAKEEAVQSIKQWAKK